jgi:hypothetical protein
VYNVTLTATNAFGTRAATKQAYIALTVPCLRYCTSTGANQNVWITNVLVSGGTLTPPFNSTSAADPNGYGNYTNRILNLRLGTTYTMSIAASANFNRSTSVWIDYNRNGVFETTELVLNGTSATSYTGTLTVPSVTSVVGFTRMRVVMRLNANPANACVQNQLNSETEDYSVSITNPLAASAARELAGLEVFPNPTPDGHLTLRLPDGVAGAYDATLENMLGAVLRRRSLRLGATSEAAFTMEDLPQGVYVLRLSSPTGQQTTRRIIRN